MKTFDANPQAALSFLQQQAAYLEPLAYEIEYPELNYTRLTSIKTNIPDWSNSYVFRAYDTAGELEFLASGAGDIANIDVAYNQFHTTLQTMALGYRYTIEEIGQAMLMGVPLEQDRVNGARRIVEQGLNKLCLLGADTTDWPGLYTSSKVSVETADKTIAALIADIDPANGTGVQPIVDFFQNAIIQVWDINTNTVWAPTNIVLPPGPFALLSATILSYTGDTLLSYLMKNLGAGFNVTFDVDVTLKQENIGASTPGNTNRMVVLTKNPDVAEFLLPMPFRFLAPATTDQVNFFVGGILRSGGTIVKLPAAMHYVDKV
jgi:hypothetical protein